MLDTLIPDLTKLIGPFVSSSMGAVVATLVKTAFEQKWADCFKQNRSEEATISNHLLSKYLARGLFRQSAVTSVILENVSKSLDDLYVPLTVQSRSRDLPLKLDCYHPSFIPRHSRLLIMDTAGMGKSTLLKFLYVSTIRENTGQIPVLIELRRLGKEKKILDIIADDLDLVGAEYASGHKFDRQLLANMVERGGFNFFLDGFDEIAIADREAVTRDITDFVAKAGKNNFILSSREEDAAKSFGFVVFSIAGLTSEEAFTLIRNYDRFNLSAVSGEDLIKELGSGQKLKSVQSFLVNPLMVSLLYASYLYARTVDLKKTTFYRNVYEALYKRHDILKPGTYEREKRTGLGEDDFYKIVSALALTTLRHGVAYDRDQLTSFILSAKEETAVPDFKPADLVEDLLKAVPLFVLDGTQYRWSHKSFQEYFVVAHIAQSADKHKMLRQMYKTADERNYWNILDLSYDIDYQAFRDTIIFDLATEVLRQFEVMKASSLPSISGSAIAHRFVVCHGCYFGYSQTAVDFDVNHP